MSKGGGRGRGFALRPVGEGYVAFIEELSGANIQAYQRVTSYVIGVLTAQSAATKTCAQG